MKWELVTPTAAHIEELASNMRQADADEAWAAAGQTPLEAVERSVQVSKVSLTGLFEGEVAAICGVASPSVMSLIGVPWFMTTPVVNKHPTLFLRICRTQSFLLEEGYERMVNYVDARHTLAIRWIRWLGYEIFPAKPYGPFKLPFHRFEKKVLWEL